MGRWAGALLLLLAVALALGGCSDDGGEEAATTGGAAGSATVPELPAAAELEGGQMVIGTGDGAVYEMRIDGTCTIPDPSSVALRGLAGRMSVTVEVTDGSGSIVIAGGDNREGRVEDVSIGEIADVTLDGTVTMVGGEEPVPQPFSLRANCVVGG